MPTVTACPTCGKPVSWVETEKFRPFCCERCKLIDLGQWAQGAYAIPGKPVVLEMPDLDGEDAGMEGLSPYPPRS